SIWLEREPDNVQALNLRGSLFRRLNAREKALTDFRRVVELDPEIESARWALANNLLEIGHFEEALQHFQHLQKRHATERDLRVAMARCYHGVGQSKQARELLDEVLAEDPNNGIALRTRGHIALLSGQPVDAEQWLRRAAAALPYDYLAQWFLYQALNQQKEK